TFTTQPTSGQNIQATGTGSFATSVAVQDVNGSTVLTDSSSVTLSIGTNPSSGVLSCTNAGGLTVSASSGVANFTGCAITKTGAGYTLTAADGGLAAPTNANAFNITAGAANATQSTLTPTSSSITANGTATQVLTVQAKDANNNNLTTGG